MRLLRLAAVGLLLSGLAMAQQGRGRGPTPNHNGSSALVQALYQQARQAAAAAPAPLPPVLLASVASDEITSDPAQALDDYIAAFEQAQALLAWQSDGDVAAQAIQAIQDDTELRAVTALARRGETGQALALTRLADGDKIPLYDQVVAATGRSRSHDTASDDTDSDPSGAFDRIFDLVQECKRAVHAYPYAGVATVLRRPGVAGLERMMLVQDAYTWAGNETEPARMGAATALLQAGHRAEPELDGMLESTVTTLLLRLDEGENTTDPAAINADSRLMALLGTLDPAAAQALTRQYPMQAMAASNAAATNPSSSLSFSFAAPYAPAADASEAAGAAQFATLLAQAESLQRRDPGAALSLANQASLLLDAVLLASQTEAAARLAALYQNLGSSADASRLLSRCLDEADRQGRALDTGFNGADAGQQAQMAESLASEPSTVVEVYSLAARVDFIATMQRAESAPFVLLQPLVLARIALIGAVAASSTAGH